MASGAAPSSFRLNSVDRHGKQIDPAVLTAAEAVFPRALEYGVNLLGDAAVVANTLEEVAGTVSQLIARRDPPSGPAPIRNLPGYMFRAFAREVNRLTSVMRKIVIRMSGPAEFFWFLPRIARSCGRCV
jgi:hypothetical protein